MDQSAVMAASGLHSRTAALDMLANNLANANTTGFKLDRQFYSLFSGDSEGADGEGSAQLPNVKTSWTDFSQGTLNVTKNPLDFALDGPGFFVLNGPKGPLYTRNGEFQFSSAGVLTTADGYEVQSVAGHIQSLNKAPITVAPNGQVTQNGLPLGQLEVVNFTDPQVLKKIGDSNFVNSSSTAKPTTSTATILQGQLEGSNVNPAESSVGLVGVIRQFEMLQKAVLSTEDMNKQAIQEVARVGGGA